MNKKILFFDIDGTLASTTGIIPSNITALKVLKEKGHSIMIASGRPSHYIENLFQDLIDGYISSNGRFIKYQNKVVLDKPLTLQEIEEIITLCNNAKCGYLLVSHDKAYLGNKKYIEGYDLQSYFKDTYSTSWNKEDITVYMFDLFYNSKEHLSTIKKIFKNTHIINDHHQGSADISTRSFTKGDAVQYITKHLGLQKKDSYAFGDGDNDIQMFHAVGTAVAMGNAVNKAKEAADYITDNYDQDGIYKALLHYKIVNQ